jgi:hypothetical protein
VRPGTYARIVGTAAALGPGAGCFIAPAPPDLDVDEPPAACEADAPVRLVATDEHWRLDRERTWAVEDGEHMLLVRRSGDADVSVYRAHHCLPDPAEVAREAVVAPATPDPSAPLPAGLACGVDSYGAAGFVRLDLSGAADPSPALIGFRCPGVATFHGTLVDRDQGDGTRELWLFPDLLDESGGRRLRRGVGEWVHFAEDADHVIHRDGEALRVLDLRSGEDVVLRTGVRAFWGDGDWLFWRTAGDLDEVRLHDRARGIDLRLGLFTAADVPPADAPAGPDAWVLNAPRTHVLHLPWAYDAAVEAFDLQGVRVSFPLTRRPFALTGDGGALAPGDHSSEVQLARPGYLDARRLKYPPGVPNAVGTPVGAHIEIQWDRAIWRVPLDGGEYERVIGNVDFGVWLDERRLLAVHDGELATVDVTTALRTVHGAGVNSFVPGPDGGYFYSVGGYYQDGPSDPAARGLWYLPAGRLLAPP